MVVGLLLLSPVCAEYLIAMKYTMNATILILILALFGGAAIRLRRTMIRER